MDRREALSLTGLICGGTILGSGSILSGCKPGERKAILGLLNKEEIEILEDVAETILPKSESSPGAKDVNIGKFINTIVSDCYDEAEQKLFLNGFQQLNELSKLTLDDDFIDLDKEGKQQILLTLESESKAYSKNPEFAGKPHYYSVIKQLTIFGYLSSEEVGTKVLNHVPIPGRFEGCIPYQQGDKAFS